MYMIISPSLVAWASQGFDAYDEMVLCRGRIQKAIVGTHFHQTHPDFIREFRDHPGVKFVLEADDLFHPKAFPSSSNDGSWAAIIGSANFTSGGFSSNSEIALLADQGDDPKGSLRKECRKILDNFWKIARTPTIQEVDKYEEIWRRYRAVLRRASGRYGSDRVDRPIEEVPILRMSWYDYVKTVYEKDRHNVNGRAGVLDAARQLFETNFSFADIPDEARKGIAGFCSRKQLLGNGLGQCRERDISRKRLKRMMRASRRPSTPFRLVAT